MTSRARAQAIIVAMVWGICFVVIQRSLPTTAPLLLAGSRALIGGTIVMIAVFVRRWAPTHPGGQGLSVGPAPTPRAPGLWTLIALAITNVSLAFGAMYLAAGRTDAGLATILGGTQPLFLAAAGVWFFGERFSARTAAASVIAMSGLVVVAAAGSGRTSIEGIILAVTAAAAPAAGTVLVRHRAAEIDMVSVTGTTLALGGLMLLAASAVSEPWAGVAWSVETTGSLLFLGIVGTGLAYVIWFRIAARAPVGALGSTLFIVPVVGVVIAVLDGGQLPAAALAGAMLMLAGVLVASG